MTASKINEQMFLKIINEAKNILVPVYKTTNFKKIPKQQYNSPSDKHTKKLIKIYSK